MEPDFHRGTLSDNISVRDYNWSPDGSKLALASVSRDHKQVWLRVADTATGAVRTVLDEKWRRSTSPAPAGRSSGRPTR